MGTDIHPIIEVRREGRWVLHPGETLPYKYRDVSPTTPDRPTYPYSLTDRDYLKFAILGDVRNGYGFAGVETFTPLVPISSGRDLPDDLSVEVAGAGDYDETTDSYGGKADLGDHSFGYVTLAELEAYDWDQVLSQTGVLDEREYLACLIEQRIPRSWSGGVSGGGIVVLAPTDYLALYGTPAAWDGIEPGSRTYDATARYYIQHRWTQPLRQATERWRPELIAYMDRLIPNRYACDETKGTAEDVRLVFGFDS